MRTYTTMAAGEAAKLLVTTAGATRTVATVPDTHVAELLATALTALAAAVLVDAADPDLSAALRTLGVRQAEVEPAPGTLRLSVLADQPAPPFQAGTAWRSTGYSTVWHLAHVLHHVDGLPAGPARSVRRELGDLLGAADGPVVAATVTADGHDDRRLTWMVTSWLATASDDDLAAVIADDFGDGYGTDEIALAFGDLTAPVLGGGFTVRVDADAARAWIAAHKPHLLEQ